MQKLTRREFVNTSVLGAGALAYTAAYADEPAKTISPTEERELGKTGIQVTRLAMGTGMRGYQRSSAQTRQGQTKFTELMLHGVDQGIRFFDMADLYGSHPFIKNALKEIPRNQYVLLTKIWFRDGLENNDITHALPNIDRYRKELDTDVIDIALVHCVTSARWLDELKVMRDEMSELKEKGVIRAVGCSCHSLESLEAAVESPWVDVIMARINNKQQKMDADPLTIANLLKTARKNGKGIVGMKIYGEGTLVEEEQRYESLKFVIENDLVDAMTIGYEQPSHVDDTLKHVKMIVNA